MNPKSVNPKRRPETWLECQVEQGAKKLEACCEDIKASTAEKPLAALAVAFGAGYIARNLPLFRITGGAVKSSLHLLPYALLIVGAARAYEAIRNPETVTSRARSKSESAA